MWIIRRSGYFRDIYDVIDKAWYSSVYQDSLIDNYLEAAALSQTLEFKCEVINVDSITLWEEKQYSKAQWKQNTVV